MHYDQIITAVTSSPWAIEPTHGERMLQILNRRLAGQSATAADIEAAGRIRDDRDRRKGKPKAGGVALIAVHGVLTNRADWFTDVSGMASYETVGRMVDAAAADPAAEAIVFDFDSPGGTVYGVEQLALKIRAASKQKTTIGVVNGLCASAAYWLGSQASEMVVGPDSEVGSIGVYMAHVDVSRAMDASGQKITYVKAGKYKTAANPHEPLSADGAAQLQAGVDDYFEMFLAAVARGRKKSKEVIHGGFGQGGTVRARAAVAEGMADKVGSLDEVLSRWGLSSADFTRASGGWDGAMGKSTNPEVAKRRAKLTADAEIERRRAKLDASRPAAVTGGASHRTHAPHIRRRVAYHEAGHVIVHHMLGDREAWAHIEPRAGVNGECVPSQCIPDGINHGAALMAGQVAEELFCEDVPSAGYGGGGDDELFSRGIPVGVREDCRRKARRLLGGAVHAVRHVAGILESRGRVTAAEVAAALTAHPPHYWF